MLALWMKCLSSTHKHYLYSMYIYIYIFILYKVYLRIFITHIRSTYYYYYFCPRPITEQ